ncbi:MAG: hypothetical protein ACTHO8_07920 [Solirubrobacterales bacterium]
MEAAVADREAAMTEWNDGRLDDLSKRIDSIETKMDGGFADVGRGLDNLQRSLTQSPGPLGSEC